MKLTPKNSIDLSTLHGTTDTVKQRIHDLIMANIEPLPTQITIALNEQRPTIRIQYAGQSEKSILISKPEFYWMLEQIRFVKRRCFCRIGDRTIAANIHKQKALRIDKIEIMPSHFAV
jgi:hypothetical protein